MLENILKETSNITLRPRLEGVNVGDWIGFKHIMYLAEEAVAEHFGLHGVRVGQLIRHWNIALDFSYSLGRVLSSLRIDDTVRASVKPNGGDRDSGFHFRVALFAQREEGEEKVYAGKVSVRLRQNKGAFTAQEAPEALQAFITDNDGAAQEPETISLSNGLTKNDVTTSYDNNAALKELLIGKETNGFVWQWRVPYFYCHSNERMRMSGYLRMVEEVVDLFLDDRGISIQTMLKTRNWIPFCSKVEVTALRDAFIEEPIYCTFVVEDIFRDLTYTAQLDFYVLRDGRFVKVATGNCTHGYCEITSPTEWGMTSFDEHTLRALSTPA